MNAKIEIGKNDKNLTPIYSIIQAAMREADSDNIEKLKAAWPDVWKVLLRELGLIGIVPTVEGLDLITRLV